MNNYAAFLRAINVGGSKVIRMDELRMIFESLKFRNIKTFIQSGNVLFDSEQKDNHKLRSKIEAQISRSLGFDVTTTVRSRKEMETIINENPFVDERLSKDLILYISLLSGVPEKKAAEKFLALNNEHERFVIKKDNVYCLIHKKVKTLFSNNLLEKKLELPATTRNYNTILRICDLMKENS